MNFFKRAAQIASLGALLLTPALAQKGKEGAIYDQVKMRLANDPDVKGGNLGVEVKDGVVTLQGKVDKERAKLKAEKIVKKVKGVTQVINQITVEP
jgi:hyperosmotically inducible periplasmic protein